MPETMESQIKAAYVLNFVKFTEWPAGVAYDGKLKLCVVGSNVLDGTLESLQGRQAGDREVHVARYTYDTLLAGLPNGERMPGGCQVVYFGKSEQRRFIPLLKALSDSPVLTISGIDAFAENGGSIGLSYRENRIVFEVNLASVQKSKLHLSGQLLNLASFIFRK